MALQNFTAASAIALFALVSTAATAADLEVACEKRANRSRASVDGRDLRSGSYRAVLKSGDRTARSPFQQTIDDEVEFDFDSNQNDIAEGATPIPANFIVDGRVRAFLVNGNGERVTPVVRAICRVRR